MQKVLLIAVALIVAWLSVATGQTWENPSFRKNSIYVDGAYRSRPGGDFYNDSSFPGTVNSYPGEHATGDLNRYLQGYKERNQDGPGPYNQNPKRYNPYQFHW